MSNQTLTFTSDELFYIQEMMREAQANPFRPGDYQSKEINELIKRIINALNESYDMQTGKKEAIQKVLSINGANLHIRMKDGETKDEAVDRLLETLDNVKIHLSLWTEEVVEEE